MEDNMHKISKKQQNYYAVMRLAKGVEEYKHPLKSIDEYRYFYSQIGTVWKVSKDWFRTDREKVAIV